MTKRAYNVDLCVIGAGAAGLSLNITGVGKLLKARRLAKKQTVSTTR